MKDLINTINDDETIKQTLEYRFNIPGIVE